MVLNLNKKYLDTREAETYIRDVIGLHITDTTLRTLIVRGGGPRFVKIGNRVCYTKEFLDEWIESRKSDPKRNSLDKGGYHDRNKLFL